MDVETFLNRWSVAPISERADYQNFIRDVCTLIGVEPPGLHGSDVAYTFERKVAFKHDDGTSTPGYIDCYKQDRFVLEAKQSGKRMPDGELAPQLLLDLGGTKQRKPVPTTDGWDKVMRAAKRQAEGYAKALFWSSSTPPYVVLARSRYTPGMTESPT